MNQFRFEINENFPEYDGKPCPRAIKCPECSRIMEAPLLGKADNCCLDALRDGLEVWLKMDYAAVMHPSQLDLAMACISLDGLIYDMKHGYTKDYIIKHPKVLDERDEYMNKRLEERMTEHGYRVDRGKEGEIHLHEDFPENLLDQDFKPMDYDPRINEPKLEDDKDDFDWLNN